MIIQIHFSCHIKLPIYPIGIGTELLTALIPLSEDANIWTIQSGIFPENKVSLHIHEKFGFRLIGIREKIGKMLVGQYAGIWRDIMLLERRSVIAGTS